MNRWIGQRGVEGPRLGSPRLPVRRATPRGHRRIPLAQLHCVTHSSPPLPRLPGRAHPRAAPMIWSSTSPLRTHLLLGVLIPLLPHLVHRVLRLGLGRRQRLLDGRLARGVLHAIRTRRAWRRYFPTGSSDPVLVSPASGTESAEGSSCRPARTGRTVTASQPTRPYSHATPIPPSA